MVVLIFKVLKIIVILNKIEYKTTMALEGTKNISEYIELEDLKFLESITFYNGDKLWITIVITF